MKITRYGITLKRMEADDAELIRQWRNDPKISKFMFYKGEITPAMQSEWFASIDNDQNFFFIIEHNNAPAGLINISSIDWENKTAYTGLFIYDDKFLSSDIPVMASLAMLDVFFLLFDIQLVYAKVKGNNSVAHQYNSSLGFTRTKKIEFGLGYEYILQKELYLLEAKQIRNAAIHLRGNKTTIEWNEKNKVDTVMTEKLNKARKDIMKNLEVEII